MTASQIAKAALRFRDAVPLDTVNMRDLAAELGVGTMTIYNYVPNKTALVELVTDHLLRPIPIPGSEAGAWDERLLTLFRGIRTALGRHPGLRFGPSPEATRLARGAQVILVEAGFTPAEVKLAYGALTTLLSGRPPATDPVFGFAFDAIVQALKRRTA